jgi:hypothetical protein
MPNITSLSPYASNHIYIADGAIVCLLRSDELPEGS